MTRSYNRSYGLFILYFLTLTCIGIPPSSDDNSVLQLAGKSFGISCSAWKKFLDFLIDGPSLAAIENPDYLSPR